MRLITGNIRSRRKEDKEVKQPYVYISAEQFALMCLYLYEEAHLAFKTVTGDLAIAEKIVSEDSYCIKDITDGLFGIYKDTQEITCNIDNFRMRLLSLAKNEVLDDGVDIESDGYLPEWYSKPLFNSTTIIRLIALMEGIRDAHIPLNFIDFPIVYLDTSVHIFKGMEIRINSKEFVDEGDDIVDTEVESEISLDEAYNIRSIFKSNENIENIRSIRLDLTDIMDSIESIPEKDLIINILPLHRNKKDHMLKEVVAAVEVDKNSVYLYLDKTFNIYDENEKVCGYSTIGKVSHVYLKLNIDTLQSDSHRRYIDNIAIAYLNHRMVNHVYVEYINDDSTKPSVCAIYSRKVDITVNDVLSWL